jgi:hypothetical protein
MTPEDRLQCKGNQAEERDVLDVRDEDNSSVGRQKWYYDIDMCRAKGKKRQAEG